MLGRRKKTDLSGLESDRFRLRYAWQGEMKRQRKCLSLDASDSPSREKWRRHAQERTARVDSILQYGRQKRRTRAWIKAKVRISGLVFVPLVPIKIPSFLTLSDIRWALRWQIREIL